eukprot:TRINITY_DN47013_c0_g1_i1.p1 TRINITY_DN47013_c0_g1~~TRINITY_DN47013_c0_g1_i1.p1  ORF type:complete len:357 (-),score=55.09 TRINITY_DN47013_c0_g1_i1:217-1287(-)
MSQAYRVKNTFAEHPESDDEAPTMQRSNSWSGSTSTSALSETSEYRHSITGTNISHRRTAVDRCALDDSQQSGIQNSARDQAAVAQGPVEENGKNDDRHVVFESDSLAGSASASSEAVPEAASSPLASASRNGAAPQLHARMHCTPCLRFILQEPCKDGKGCKLCHLDHAGEKLRQRPSKVVRAECKRAIQKVLDSHSDKDARLDQLQPLVQPHNPFIRRLLIQKIADYENPPVLHTVGPIARTGLLQQLEHDDDGLNGAREPPDCATQVPGRELHLEHVPRNLEEFRRRHGKTQSRDTMKNSARLAQGERRSEGQLREQATAASEASSFESSAPPLLVPGIVLKTSPPGRSKVSL